jgi:hypothetical protein
MTRYLISFDDGAMTFPEEELPDVAEAAHKVVQEAKNAGVWVFGGGVVGQSTSVVATDGTVTEGPVSGDQGGRRRILGRRRALTREEALEWAAKVAVACRCAQEVRSSCRTRTSDRRPTAARPLPRVFQHRRRATQGIRNVPSQALATVGVAAGHGRRRCYRSMAIRMGRRRPPRFGVRLVDAYVHACWASRSRGGAGGVDLNAGGRLAQ